jgi:hypothetical protein
MTHSRHVLLPSPTTTTPILSGSALARERNDSCMCRSGTVFHDGSVGDTCGSSRRAGQGDGTLAERLREAISSRLVRRGEPADPASVAIIRALLVTLHIRFRRIRVVGEGEWGCRTHEQAAAA